MKTGLPKAPWGMIETALRLAKAPIKTLHQAKQSAGGNYILPSIWGDAYVVCDKEIVDSLSKDLNWNIVQKDPVTEESPDPLKQLGGDFNVTSDGYFHKHFRDSLRKQFTRSRLNDYAAELLNSFDSYTDSWDEPKGIDFSQKIGDITLHVICKGILDIDFTKTEKQHIRKTINRIYTLETQYIILGSIATSILSPWAFGYRNMAQQMRTIFDNKIDDVARCPFSKSYIKEFFEKEQNNRNPVIDIGRKKLIDDLLGLTVAGLDTVNVATTWAMRILVERPDIVAKIRTECDAARRNSIDGSLDYEDIPYARAVFLETLRLYPPFPLIIKQTVDEMLIDSTRIPPKSWIFFLAYSMHRDARWFDDPDEFKPERWESNEWGLEEAAFLPFGAGTHRCQGWELALIEGSMLISLIYEKFNVESSKQLGQYAISEIPYSYKINLCVRDGLPLRFKRRGREHVNAT